MNNSQIAHVLERIGLLLELKGENPFKTRAYYRASHIMAALPFSLEVPDTQEHLRNISGIGEAIEKKILELLKTGELAYLKKLESEIPPVMVEMMRIPGLGPKKIRRLLETLGISSIGELEYAIHENRIKLLKGFGEKTQNQILKGIELIRSFGNRALFPDARSQAEGIIKDLNALGLQEVSIAGSVRRCMEIIENIEIVVQEENHERKKTAERILEKLPAVDREAEDKKPLFFGFRKVFQ